MQIFENHNIIPEYCFGCFKVLIEPNNVIDLIKLHLLFDNLKLDNENFRKCMIEGRKNIDGNYKGFIYCKSLEEAENAYRVIRDLGEGLAKKDAKFRVASGVKELANELKNMNLKYAFHSKRPNNLNSLDISILDHYF